MTKHVKGFLGGFLLPVLVALYPVIFLYSSNTKVLQLNTIVEPLLIELAAALLVYGMFFLFQRRAVPASLSAAVFMIFFNGFGIFYQWLVKRSHNPVEHWILLPLVILLACGLGFLLSLLQAPTAKSLQTIFLLVALGLVGFNILTALPAEIQKARLMQARAQTGKSTAGLKPQQKLPDIYYIVFDEYAGFDAIRGYWHQNYVNEFEAQLKANHFFVAENSHSKSTSTLIELNSRLNFKYPLLVDPIVQFEDITDNKLFETVKSFGYTTVVVNKGFPPFHADYNFTYSGAVFEGFGAGEFRQLLLENSMLVAFEDALRSSSAGPARQRDAVRYALEKATHLEDIRSPKFVFVYVQFPHWPFIVDRDGQPINEKYQYNWNYYLGQHQYATKLAMDLIDRLMQEADPRNPPVIILQSDHGARNVALPSGDNVTLPDYPRDYQTLILNALYLPGFDYAKLSDDISPIRTIEIVINHTLNTTVMLPQTVQ